MQLFQALIVAGPAGFRTLAAVLLLGLPMPLAAQDGTEYLLSRGDTVRLQIVDRLVVAESVATIEKLSGLYGIDTAGNLNIAFVGLLEAEGLSLRELSGLVANALIREFGLVDAPGVAASVEAYAPVYVVGNVDAPGAYSLPPGALAVQALAVAGGTRTTTDQTYTIERDLVEGRFDRLILSENTRRLEARAARLEAERENAEAIEFPADLRNSDDDAARDAMEMERRAFALSRQAFAETLAELDELATLLRTEIAANERKLASQQERLDVVGAASDDLDQLAERGLVRTDRLLAIQSTQASIEVTVIDLEQSIFEGRARLAEIGRERQSLQTGRAEAALAELIETRDRLAVARRQIEKAGTLSAVSRDSLGLATVELTAGSDLRFRILRQGPGGLQQIAAAADTPLRPNDVLQVTGTEADD